MGSENENEKLEGCTNLNKMDFALSRPESGFVTENGKDTGLF